eukprot:SAG31_NODE_3326_length_4408_cov_3.213739_4_plen_72_part_00
MMAKLGVDAGKVSKKVGPASVEVAPEPEVEPAAQLAPAMSAKAANELSSEEYLARFELQVASPLQTDQLIL